MHFATSESATLKDLTTRNTLSTKAIKGLQIPKHVLDERLVEQVESVEIHGLNININLIC